MKNIIGKILFYILVIVFSPLLIIPIIKYNNKKVIKLTAMITPQFDYLRGVKNKIRMYEDLDLEHYKDLQEEVEELELKYDKVKFNYDELRSENKTK